MAIKTLNDYNIANKKILVRADLNVPQKMEKYLIFQDLLALLLLLKQFNH